MSISIEKVSTDSFEMAYFRFGTGNKTLVILPGLSVQSVMGFAESVESEYSVMTNDFTVYVFDRRAALPPVYAVRDMARDTAAAFRALGLRDIYLFGASQGGMMAIEIALQCPALLRKLALGSTSSHLKEAQFRTMEAWMALAEKKDRVGLYLAFGEKLYPPALYAQYREMLIAAAESVTEDELERFAVLARGSKDFNVTDRLQEILCPVLVIGSRDDAVVGPDATAEMAERWTDRPDCEVCWYPGYGHAAYDTAPDYRERLYSFFMA